MRKLKVVLLTFVTLPEMARATAYEMKTHWKNGQNLKEYNWDRAMTAIYQQMRKLNVVQFSAKEQAKMEEAFKKNLKACLHPDIYKDVMVPYEFCIKAWDGMHEKLLLDFAKFTVQKFVILELSAFSMLSGSSLTQERALNHINKQILDTYSDCQEYQLKEILNTAEKAVDDYFKLKEKV